MFLELEGVSLQKALSEIDCNPIIQYINQKSYSWFFSLSLIRSEASVFVMLHIQGLIGHWRLLSYSITPGNSTTHFSGMMWCMTEKKG